MAKGRELEENAKLELNRLKKLVSKLLAQRQKTILILLQHKRAVIERREELEKAEFLLELKRNPEVNKNAFVFLHSTSNKPDRTILSTKRLSRSMNLATRRRCVSKWL